jgi:serine/threonine-protein kinase Chk2
LAIKVILEDLSSNGTWVNSIIIGRNKYREIEHGDEITLAGGYRYHFRFPTTSISTGFKDNFTLGPLLGSGHFANVYSATEKKSGKLFAVKVFKKSNRQTSNTQDLQQEIALLMSVGHPNILCLKFPYDEPDGVYLVLELAPEGELFNYILQCQKIPEHDTRKIVIQLLNGLKYLVCRSVLCPNEY